MNSKFRTYDLKLTTEQQLFEIKEFFLTLTHPKSFELQCSVCIVECR